MNQDFLANKEVVPYIAADIIAPHSYAECLDTQRGVPRYASHKALCVFERGGDTKEFPRSDSRHNGAAQVFRFSIKVCVRACAAQATPRGKEERC